ncbi:hypothetical protein W97_00799 [Coniosporium apollinis CBS 100218]|uniref:Uncharacterized protein n=1 Tax=Coniosporium apollinis (strain CBS 100218) TaxID=1168221 RepID=R7YII4_CONA1|nr:uncharacterized protein W97_00799 [Coniosporium apollinis CBS 100218]EON61584.1 hypothetical protein W97_00799 [Coniosporium apollinis CBS 100218]
MRNMHPTDCHEDYEPLLEEARREILTNAYVLYGGNVAIFLCGERNQEGQQKFQEDRKRLKDQLEKTDPTDVVTEMALMQEMDHRAHIEQAARRYPGLKSYAVLARRKVFRDGRPCQLEVLLEGPRVDGGPYEAMQHLFGETMVLMGEKVQDCRGAGGDATVSEPKS